MIESSRSKTLEVMAKGYCAAECRGHRVTACNPCRHWDLYSEEAERLFSHLRAEGMAVVPRERMVDYFAEIDAAIVSIQGALRHYQQPQDVHFHLALKSCRDGAAMLAASPYGKAVVKEKDDE